MHHEKKEAIAKLFPRAQIVNMYGMQEFNGILFEENNHMISLKENAHIEILDNDGNQCAPGNEGNVVVTGLINSVFPLIRYNTGDRGKIIENNEQITYEITSSKSVYEFYIDGNKYNSSIFYVIIKEYNN